MKINLRRVMMLTAIIAHMNPTGINPASRIMKSMGKGSLSLTL